MGHCFTDLSARGRIPCQDCGDNASDDGCGYVRHLLCHLNRVPELFFGIRRAEVHEDKVHGKDITVPHIEKVGHKWTVNDVSRVQNTTHTQGLLEGLHVLRRCVSDSLDERQIIIVAVVTISFLVLDLNAIHTENKAWHESPPFC